MRNAALIVAAIAVLVIGFVLVQGAGDKGSGTSAGTTTTQETAAPAATTSTGATSTAAPAPKPKPKVPTVAFAGGKPTGGVKKFSFDKGDTVRFRVTSDVAEEIHVHGFDKKADIAAGKSVSFDFPAKFDGSYEVEMEGSGQQIASLEIQP